jgi:uncharacterized protein YbjQ (UPF0145 family)
MSFSDEYKRDRQRRSLKQVEAGGLPLDAEWRLNRLRDNRKLFTSNLSVNELALGVSTGIHPVGQVMGASTYHIGWQRTAMYTPMVSQQLPTLTHALTHARNLAVGRLQKEAKLLGADGVVGVRIERRIRENAKNVFDYIAIGTAVQLAGSHRWSTPFISAMSVQELWSLLRVGHFPVGFVFGGCVYYHVASFTNQMIQQTYRGMTSRNIELSDYSSAISFARQFAMGQVEFEAQALNADGVVGVTVESHVDTVEVELEINETKVRRRDLIVQFTAQGSAIVPASSTTYAVDYTVELS